MFSALKKLTKGNDDRCAAPMPMSSSLQKKFSRGVHFNMKILIKGDRNVGKSCLLQRLQGGVFIEDYVPTEQIQVAPIHWTYKNTDYIIKVEVWEVVDKGKTKKKAPLGLKLENQTAAAPQEEGYNTPVLDATFLDVYKNATGVILMLDITKPWTFDYVVKELSRVPADLPVVVLGNHCDMQHHRQVHPHHIEQALHHAKMTRTAPVRYAESSMRNGFGLRLLHKFLSVPFLRLQKISLLEQLQRNQKDMEEIEKELDDFQNSEESHYNLFVDRLANKRRQNNGQTDIRPNNDRSPSIVLGAGKPIIPPNVNPLLAQSLTQTLPKVQSSVAETPQVQQTHYVSPELTKMKPRHTVSGEMTPARPSQDSNNKSSPPGATATSSSGVLDEFYAGTLDSSFLEDLTPLSTPAREEFRYESESEDGDETNPKVTVDDDDLDIDIILTETNVGLTSTTEYSSTQIRPKDDLQRFQNEEIVLPENKLGLKLSTEHRTSQIIRKDDDLERFMSRATISSDSIKDDSTDLSNISALDSRHHIQLLDSDFPIWAGDSSARRSPEGGEDPDVSKERDAKEKKHKKKKSKDKDKGDYSDKSDRKEKKHKHKKSKSEKRPHPQQDLLAPTAPTDYDNCEEYDSI